MPRRSLLRALPPLLALPLLALPLLALAACASSAPPDGGSTSPSTVPSTPASAGPHSTNAAPPADGFVRHPGSPDPLACTTDADCAYGQTYDDSGCCGTFHDMAATAQSKAYLKHASDWREAHCADHACPSPPVPTEPPPCLFEVKCAKKQCRNACR